MWCVFGSVLGFLFFMLSLSWNIRGLGRREKRRVVKNLVLKFKPMLLFLQETKLGFFDSSLIRSLGGGWLARGVGVEAEGASGGLISLWNEDSFTVSDCISNKSCIILVGRMKGFDKDLAFCNIYAANDERDRKSSWEFILQVQHSFPIPWCLGGDFNTVLCASERKGGDRNNISMRNFNFFCLTNECDRLTRLRNLLYLV